MHSVGSRISTSSSKANRALIAPAERPSALGTGVLARRLPKKAGSRRSRAEDGNAAGERQRGSQDNDTATARVCLSLVRPRVRVLAATVRRSYRELCRRKSADRRTLAGARISGRTSDQRGDKNDLAPPRDDSSLRWLVEAALRLLPIIIEVEGTPIDSLPVRRS